MSLFGGINYNKTFISTTTMLFIFTITLGLLFFVSALSHQTFAQEGNIYEGLGIKLKYFDPWTIEGNDDDPSCLIKGNFLANDILAQPSPQPTSRTRPPFDLSLFSISGIEEIYFAISLANMGLFPSPCANNKSIP
jgi:hypothetical protein